MKRYMKYNNLSSGPIQKTIMTQKVWMFSKGPRKAWKQCNK
jgi:hypothetical protein